MKNNMSGWDNRGNDFLTAFLAGVVFFFFFFAVLALIL